IRHDRLDHRVPVRSSDELGRLAEEFNRMAEVLSEHRREAENRFNKLAENIQEVFWMSDARLERLLFMSPLYEKIFGRAVQEPGEQTDGWIETVVHSDDRAAVRENVEQRRSGIFNDMEYRVVRPDGSIRWVRSRAFPI